MVAADLGLGTIVDGFARIKRWLVDQAATNFIDGFAGFVGNYGKSRSDRSEVKQPSMQELVDPVVGAADPVEVVCCRCWADLMLLFECLLVVCVEL